MKQPVVQPQPVTRRRTQRNRLLAALDVTNADRWPLTWRHMADKLVLLESGKITTVFPDCADAV